MIENLRNAFRRVDQSDVEHEQQEAMVDLLFWTMYSDNTISLPENEAIDRVVDEFSENTSLPLAQYVGASTAKVRDVLGDSDKAEALLDDIYERLGTQDNRAQAYEACCELAQADGQVAEEEEAFLKVIRTHFNVKE